MNGQPFVAYVAEQWRLYHLEKEREKQERVSGGFLWRPPEQPPSLVWPLLACALGLMACGGGAAS